METIFPPPLQKGDLIALVFPASFFTQNAIDANEILESKAAWLKLQGYRTVFYPEKINRHGYLAGKDNERAEAFMNAWKNEEVKAIWCFRGGYGSTRILDYLDYEIIKAHPKILIGMSDITALHQAIGQKTGLVTFLGPTLSFFGKPDFDDEYAFSSFETTASNQITDSIPLPPDYQLKILRPGNAQGILVGGNLSLIATLCGTKWQPDTQGKILLLEDVNETIYVIDRKLWQLKAAGLLDNPAAIILGTWTNCNPNTPCSLTLTEVFDHYFDNAPYPVIQEFPSGHDKYQATLPLNAPIEIDTESKRVTIFKSTHNITPLQQVPKSL